MTPSCYYFLLRKKLDEYIYRARDCPGDNRRYRIAPYLEEGNLAIPARDGPTRRCSIKFEALGRLVENVPPCNVKKAPPRRDSV